MSFCSSVNLTDFILFIILRFDGKLLRVVKLVVVWATIGIVVVACELAVCVGNKVVVSVEVVNKGS